MASEIDDLAKETKTIISSILTSTPLKINIKQLNKDFYETVGYGIPYTKLGFSNLELYLRSLSDRLRVVGVGEFAEVEVIVGEKTAHINELVSRQRVVAKKKTSRNVMRNMKRPHSSQPPRIDNYRPCRPQAQPYIFQSPNMLYGRYVNFQFQQQNFRSPEHFHTKLNRIDSSGYYPAPRYFSNCSNNWNSSYDKRSTPNNDGAFVNVPQKSNAPHATTPSNNTPRTTAATHTSHASASPHTPHASAFPDDRPPATPLPNNAPRTATVPEDKPHTITSTNDTPRTVAPSRNTFQTIAPSVDTVYRTASSNGTVHVPTSPKDAPHKGCTKSNRSAGSSGGSEKERLDEETTQSRLGAVPKLGRHWDLVGEWCADQVPQDNLAGRLGSSPNSDVSDENAIFFSDEEEPNTKVPQIVQDNLRKLITKHPDGIWCVKMPDLYKDAFGAELNYVDYGYRSLAQMCIDLGNVFHCLQPHLGDVKLFDKSKPIPRDMLNTIKRFEYLRIQASEQTTEAALPQDSVQELLANVYSYDAPPDTVKLGHTIVKEWITPDTKELDYIDVCVGEIYDPSKFWINLKIHSPKLDALMDNMQTYYMVNCKRLEVPTYAMTKGLYVAVVFLAEYHRGKVIDVSKIETNVVKVFFIDYGTVSLVRSEGICYLHQQFADLPEQAIRARLAGIYPPVVHQQWSRQSSSRFLELVLQKNLVAQVIAIDAKRQALELVLADTSAKNEDFYVNDALVHEGHAIFTSQEQYESEPMKYVPIVEYIHLFPTFGELEMGLLPTATQMIVIEEAGVGVERIYPHYYQDVETGAQPIPNDAFRFNFNVDGKDDAGTEELGSNELSPVQNWIKRIENEDAEGTPKTSADALNQTIPGAPPESASKLGHKLNPLISPFKPTLDDECRTAATGVSRQLAFEEGDARLADRLSGAIESEWSLKDDCCQSATPSESLVYQTVLNADSKVFTPKGLQVDPAPAAKRTLRSPPGFHNVTPVPFADLQWFNGTQNFAAPFTPQQYLPAGGYLNMAQAYGRMADGRQQFHQQPAPQFYPGPQLQQYSVPVYHYPYHHMPQYEPSREQFQYAGNPVQSFGNSGLSMEQLLYLQKLCDSGNAAAPLANQINAHSNFIVSEDANIKLTAALSGVPGAPNCGDANVKHPLPFGPSGASSCTDMSKDVNYNKDLLSSSDNRVVPREDIVPVPDVSATELPELETVPPLQTDRLLTVSGSDVCDISDSGDQTENLKSEGLVMITESGVTGSFNRQGDAGRDDVGCRTMSYVSKQELGNRTVHIIRHSDEVHFLLNEVTLYLLGKPVSNVQIRKMLIGSKPIAVFDIKLKNCPELKKELVKLNLVEENALSIDVIPVRFISDLVQKLSVRRKLENVEDFLTISTQLLEGS